MCVRTRAELQGAEPQILYMFLLLIQIEHQKGGRAVVGGRKEKERADGKAKGEKVIRNGKNVLL